MKKAAVFLIVIFLLSSVSAYSFNDFVEDVRGFFSESTTGNVVLPTGDVTNEVWEDATTTVSCPSGSSITDIEAYYYCPDGTGRAMYCPSVLGIGQQLSSFTFTNTNCGSDPCVNVRKKGILAATCSVSATTTPPVPNVSSNTKTVSVWDIYLASLNCDSGLIKSASAVYWCPDGTGRKTSCNTPNAVGKSSYSFTFSNGNCGDPCPYVEKKGNLTITCGEAVSCVNYSDELGCLSDSRCEWAQGVTFAKVCQEKTIAKSAGEDSCVDSDGGKNYYEKGTLNFNNREIYDDSCIGDEVPSLKGQLTEYFCDEDGRKSIVYECPNGCFDGACLTSAPSTDVCSSDFNKDGVVDDKDYGLFWDNYGKSDNNLYDLNHDEKIDREDSVVIVKNFGKTCDAIISIQIAKDDYNRGEVILLK
ncbi:MAG: hypothetical protein KKC19_03650 [Nanoarchaeota archaeon]|nr:hypothetical protein [Nanoarchaeota archaeon]